MKYLPILLSSSFLAVAASQPVMAGEGGDPRIGEDVNKICFSTDINRWRSVKGEDGVILLDRSSNEWYRAEISEGCSERLISRAQLVQFDSNPGTSCLHLNDKIIVHSYGALSYSCRIKRISRWDHTAPAPDDESGEGDEAASY